MTKITPAELKALHTLLSKFGFMDQKKEMILDVSGGRTDSSRDLYSNEARLLIGELKKMDPQQKSVERMRARVLAMAHEMGWQVDHQGKVKVDMERVNNWCMKYGFGKKALNHYSFEELPRLVSQFQVGPYKAFKANL